MAGYSAIAPYYYYCYCCIERNVHQNSACSAGQQKPLSIELTARRLISKNFFAHALWHGWPSAILFSRTFHLSLSYFARKRVRKSVETLGIRTECFSNEWYGFMKPQHVQVSRLLYFERNRFHVFLLLHSTQRNCSYFAP